MSSKSTFTDIHCHIVPGIDDGSANLTDSLSMARTAEADGTKSIVATPHQLGANSQVSAEAIRQGVADLQTTLNAEGVGVSVLPGADVRIEPELPKLVKQGKVLTLADKGKHVLLELPHETYFPLEPLLAALSRQGLVGILSHPERNRGIIKNPDVMWDVVEAGGLLQITAGSLTGAFGRSPQKIAELCVTERLIHFIASDAHDKKNRPFGMRAAYDTIIEMAEEGLAELVCCENPAKVVAGDEVGGGVVGRRRLARKTKGGSQKPDQSAKPGGWLGWFGR
jgi:protein-tyrosine phosphatase